MNLPNGDIGVLLDFDRTLTERKEYHGLDPFSEAWSHRFVLHREISVLGLTPWDVQAWLAKICPQIRERPAHFSWLQRGFATCAASDEFLRVSVVGQMILDHHQHLLDLEEREVVLNQVYAQAYPFAEHELRLETPRVLNQLRGAGVSLEILTNSDPTRVREIITASSKRLGHRGSLDWILPKVVGFAKKGTITPEQPTDIPETKYIRGLRRPIFLRREHAISAARTFAAGKKKVYIVDDNPELGLHWAMELGFTPILIANEDTPLYEVIYFTETPGCHLIYSLDELPPIIILS